VIAFRTTRMADRARLDRAAQPPRCWCGRPVARDVADAVLCAEHDNPPPRPRPGIPHPGMGASIGLALCCMAVPFGILAQQFDARFDIQPSPDGAIVVPAVDR